MRQIKVLVVDDSIMFRNLLVKGLQSDSSIKVVAAVNDPFEARDAIIQYDPDVMVLDIELPRMNGIEFLRRLMPQYPVSTVVMSARNDKVFEAMSVGAVDFVEKPSSVTMQGIQTFVVQELIVKVKIASTVKVGKLKKAIMNEQSRVDGANERKMILAIGASTGGTEAIYNVVKEFDRHIPGVVIVQHMPPDFTAMYAKRLNEQCRIVAKEAKTGDRVIPGQVLIAPGDRQMKIIKVNGEYQVECRGNQKVNGHCPSVDVLFSSVAKQAGKNAIGVILTGMGADGAQGLLEMRKAGAETIGQNEATSVVYGMPKVAYEIGAVKYQAALADIPRQIYSILNRMN